VKLIKERSVSITESMEIKTGNHCKTEEKEGVTDWGGEEGNQSYLCT
jgi:hypothetical protein